MDLPVENTIISLKDRRGALSLEMSLGALDDEFGGRTSRGPQRPVICCWPW